MSDELWDDLPDVGVGHSAAVGELRSALPSATSPTVASVPATPESIPCEAQPRLTKEQKVKTN